MDGNDLAQIEARVDSRGSYTYHSAHDDVRKLIKEVRRLQDHDVAVARLIDLALSYGASAKAIWYLRDALTELGALPWHPRQDVGHGHLSPPQAIATSAAATEGRTARV
jgi:hypothetical protein